LIVCQQTDCQLAVNQSTEELTMNQRQESASPANREACVLTQPKNDSNPTTTDSGAPVGEGSYEGSKRYAESIGNYLETADVTADAKAAAPKSPQEARELREAEAEAKNHTRGEGEGA
jgi:hypothetical protein